MIMANQPREAAIKELKFIARHVNRDMSITDVAEALRISKQTVQNKMWALRQGGVNIPKKNENHFVVRDAIESLKEESPELFAKSVPITRN